MNTQQTFLSHGLVSTCHKKVLLQFRRVKFLFEHMVKSCEFFIVLCCKTKPSKRSDFTPVIWTTLNTLRPKQNGHHFADDTFKCIFLKEYVLIPIKISLKFVPESPINNIPALVQVKAWRGAVQATSHYLNQWWLVYRRIYASLGLNELTYRLEERVEVDMI